MADNDFQYDIFISYSRKDKDAVLRIKDEIETLGFKCWIDLEGIESGADEFSEYIVNAIDASSSLLFFLSGDSQKSECARKEIKYAKDERKHVVVVRFNDEPLVGWFKFNFADADMIDWRRSEQRQKLLRDLRFWADELTETLMTEAELYSEDNRSKAADIYQRCAGRGSALAAYRLGEIYEREGNGDVAFEWYDQAAKHGDADMQYRVGVKHYDARDYKQAVKFFHDAANGGQRDAQVNLAKMLEDGGRGAKKDERVAFEWYWKAAEQGVGDAWYALGQMYEQGRGGARKDREKAKEYYRRAVELGSEDARKRLAEMEKEEHCCLCKILRLVKFLLVTAAVLCLAVIIAIFVLLVKAGIISY